MPLIRYNPEAQIKVKVPVQEPVKKPNVAKTFIEWIDSGYAPIVGAVSSSEPGTQRKLYLQDQVEQLPVGEPQRYNRIKEALAQERGNKPPPAPEPPKVTEHVRDNHDHYTWEIWDDADGHHAMLYADTAFLTYAGRCGEVKHLGFGDFSVTINNKEAMFIRSDDYPIQNKSGRGHWVKCDDDDTAKKLVQMVEWEMTKDQKPKPVEIVPVMKINPEPTPAPITRKAPRAKVDWKDFFNHIKR